MGRPKGVVMATSDRKILHRGRWRKVAPLGWDDASVERDARAAMQQAQAVK